MLTEFRQPQFLCVTKDYYIIILPEVSAEYGVTAKVKSLPPYT